ncbi:MAG: hypothetical protein IT426_04400 [Pirellulales bacterium]|nr:hypothetical protein [Pirellulales bacterium]
MIFTMVDHYEPGGGAAGAKRNERWLEAFRPLSNSHRDALGNRFRYTWFYPYDHGNETVMAALAKMAYEGYGEVEFHWHHPTAGDAAFPAMLQEALVWFGKFGALVSSEPKPQNHFAFIHGNWALDNSLPICGVDHELDILFRHGCYADFTFSSIAAARAHPRKVNSLYYPATREGPKSYDRGADVAVGVPVNDRAMIFQGPLGLNWWTGRFEYGAVESFALPRPARIDKWIDADIHVKGRPEWTFVKVYSHGVQSAPEIVHGALGPMLGDLERICRERRIHLHYMTAREAFNVAKAAEAGKTGCPSEYRDFLIPKPRNMVFPVDAPADADSVNEIARAPSLSK